jgi:hypothetical protein
LRGSDARPFAPVVVAIFGCALDGALIEAETLADPNLSICTWGHANLDSLSGGVHAFAMMRASTRRSAMLYFRG